jgi:MFS family permease
VAHGTTVAQGSTAAGETTEARVSTFAALRHPNYRLFWSAQTLSVLGQTMEFVALGWLVYGLTGSAVSLGLTGLAQALPRIVLVMLGGAVADRVDRRQLLIAVQAIVAALYITLATLVFFEVVQVWHVWALAFILGALRAFDNPSRQSIVPQLVGKDEIPSAVALGNLAWEVPRLIGPAAAGVLISLIGIASTFYVAALGFILSMLMYTLMRVSKVVSADRGRNLLKDMADGLDFVRRHELFAALIGLVFFNSMFGMSYQILLPVFARDILEVGSEGFGFLQTAVALGAILGSLAAARLGRSGHRGVQLLLGSALFGLLIVAFAWSRWFPLSVVIMFLMGLANSFYMITINTVLQVMVPDDYRGRVMGLWSLTWSLVPLGGMIAGTITEHAGAPVAVTLGGVLVMAMAAAIAIRLPNVRQLA